MSFRGAKYLVNPLAYEYEATMCAWRYTSSSSAIRLKKRIRQNRRNPTKLLQFENNSGGSGRTAYLRVPFIHTHLSAAASTFCRRRQWKYEVALLNKWRLGSPSTSQLFCVVLSKYEHTVGRCSVGGAGQNVDSAERLLSNTIWH